METVLDLVEMRLAAEEATRGDWKIDPNPKFGRHPVSIVWFDKPNEGYLHDVALAFTKSDARFIALCSPGRILALLDEMERLQKQVERTCKKRK